MPLAGRDRVSGVFFSGNGESGIFFPNVGRDLRKHGKDKRDGSSVPLFFGISRLCVRVGGTGDMPMPGTIEDRRRSWEGFLLRCGGVVRPCLSGCRF